MGSLKGRGSLPQEAARRCPASPEHCRSTLETRRALPLVGTQKRARDAGLSRAGFCNVNALRGSRMATMRDACTALRVVVAIWLPLRHWVGAAGATPISSPLERHSLTCHSCMLPLKPPGVVEGLRAASNRPPRVCRIVASRLVEPLQCLIGHACTPRAASACASTAGLAGRQVQIPGSGIALRHFLSQSHVHAPSFLQPPTGVGGVASECRVRTMLAVKRRPEKYQGDERDGS